MRALSAAERKAYQAYRDTRSEVIKARTGDVPQFESSAERTARIERTRSTFERFAKYYFPHYCQSNFAYFHKDAAKRVVADPNIYAVFEWPREHAKSVFANVLLPLYLKGLGQLDGMVVVSANQTKAIGLLIDIQLELQNNQRFIADYGEQYNFGNWEEGQFTTRDGCGFWALGRGQSPRGIRSQEKRPNYGICDDLDDDELVLNEERVEKTLDWVEGALFPCFSTLGARFIIAGNRIARNSVLANLVGDVNEGDKVKSSIYHSKVFALENPRTRKMDRGPKGVPAWKERYTREILEEKWSKIRNNMVLREFFHMTITIGKLFKREWIHFTKPLKLNQYKLLVAYVDPSWKDGKNSDYKAIVLIGCTGRFIHLLKVWVRQATRPAMAAAHYDIYEWVQKHDGAAYHFIEGGLMQDQHLESYLLEGNVRGYTMPITIDDRKKPDKKARIEGTLQGEFELGSFLISEELKNDPDYTTWQEQLLAFPTGHDDAPDATEGAVHIAKQKIRMGGVPDMSGSSRRNTRRGY